MHTEARTEQIYCKIPIANSAVLKNVISFCSNQATRSPFSRFLLPAQIEFADKLIAVDHTHKLNVKHVLTLLDFVPRLKRFLLCLFLFGFLLLLVSLALHELLVNPGRALVFQVLDLFLLLNQHLPQ